MIILLEETSGIKKVCGKQMFHEGKEYHYSQYCIAISCDQGELLFHTLTGALILVLDEQDKEKSMKELVQHWYFVPEGFDEQAFADEIREILIRFKPVSEHKTSFTVFTTTECNARCFYCYEKGIPHFPMSTEVAQEVGKYIAEKSGGEKVNISWFGGEPLYNMNAIDTICSILQKNDVSYDSIMTSNGYYLDAETACKAKNDWHVKTVQVTLDGTEMVYNRTKAYINRDVDSPFQRVMDNIANALDSGLEVAVRLNMDAANADDLFILAEQIEKRFGHHPNLFGRAALLGKFTEDIHAFHSAQEAANQQKLLQAKLDGFGMVRRKELGRHFYINQCMADNSSCEVILPDGRIERCEHIRESEVVGSIYNEARDTEKIEAWKETIYFPECMECELYPMCVNLKKCEWQKDGCSEIRRNNNRRNMHAAIIAAYHQQKEFVGRNQDEDEAELYTGGSRW